MVKHNWPGTSPHLRLVEDDEQEIAANRSMFDEHASPIRERASDLRLAPLRRERVLVGGGWTRRAHEFMRGLLRMLFSARSPRL